MTSGRFILGETVRKDSCVRFLLVLILFGVVTVAVLVGCYAFNSAGEYFEGCKQPELDPYGLSNWTHGAEKVAFGCFPGHQMEGWQDQVLVSHCIQKIWHPPPPACAALPIALECAVNQNGIKGTIRMWQISNSTPTHIHGFLGTADVNKSQGLLMEGVELSRIACQSTSENITDTMPDAAAFEENVLEVRFTSTKLLAYKKAELRVTMVFIDVPSNLTGTVVSVHQAQETLVMKLPFPQPSSGWSFNTNCDRNQKQPIQLVGEDAAEKTVDEGLEVRQGDEDTLQIVDKTTNAEDEEHGTNHGEDQESIPPETQAAKLHEYHSNHHNPRNYPAQEDSY